MFLLNSASEKSKMARKFKDTARLAHGCSSPKGADDLGKWIGLSHHKIESHIEKRYNHTEVFEDQDAADDQSEKLGTKYMRYAKVIQNIASPWAIGRFIEKMMMMMIIARHSSPEKPILSNDDVSSSNKKSKTSDIRDVCSLRLPKFTHVDHYVPAGSLPDSGTFSFTFLRLPGLLTSCHPACQSSPNPRAVNLLFRQPDTQTHSSATQNNTSILGSYKGHPIRQHLQNNASPLLACNTEETKSDLKFDWRDDGNHTPQWKNQPQSGLQEEEQDVSMLHPQNKRNGQRVKGREEHRDSRGQGQVYSKTKRMPDKGFDQFTYIKQSKGQNLRNGSDTKDVDVVAKLSRPQFFNSGSPASRPVQAVPGESLTNKGYQLGPLITPLSQEGECGGTVQFDLIEHQDQHSNEQRVTDPEDCGYDDDREYRARLNAAYRTNFCEETADLFIRTMEAGRWDDIVYQLNLTKSKGDQLLSSSVSTLKQKAGEAYDSHPHHSSPPESVFRLQENLVREAVLELAQQCRQQNVMSPQTFGEKNK